MKKVIFVFTVSIILIAILFTGCQEEEGITIENPMEGVFFESDILEIYNGSFVIDRNKNGIVTSAEVIFYFRNLLDRNINNLKISVDFCDKNDNVLKSFPYTFFVFPAGYMERSANAFFYDGDNVIHVDHVNIHVIEYEIE